MAQIRKDDTQDNTWIVDGDNCTVILKEVQCYGGVYYELSGADIETHNVQCSFEDAAAYAQEVADSEECDAAEHDPFLSDAEADADVLASAGWGTDEDYGCYGDE